MARWSALGITAATTMLALILAGTTVAKDRALAQDVDRLPAAARRSAPRGLASPPDRRTTGTV